MRSNHRDFVANLIVQAAKDGAKHGDKGRMCNGCAFKKGTEANDDEIVIDAEDSLFSPALFMCHEIDRICVGYKYALAATDNS